MCLLCVCRVHIYNVSELLLCALPYHSTPEFARLVAVLQLKGGPWEWLTPCQQTGAPPPRELLVRRCVNDQVHRTPGTDKRIRPSMCTWGGGSLSSSECL